ncbi:four helix bundle protein [Carboxylicivirga mesophila]|uniref:Four helix bundle protein n=1 Tax=Carboxylicivirga mesophila TaxID=1166478 RepID=A0ABS5K4D2_9BACT|nr:four helix bundle protein [Carboxylicivirga mesophila]MBS2209817.1 four helix bundle protein [Carboxylicivirga mesophila]
MKKNSPLRDKSYLFAIKIVELTRELQNMKEFVLSRQVLRSGTSVGALIREAEFAQSKADFIHKMSISLKEANETDYWLNLLFDTDYLAEIKFDQLSKQCNELIAMLVSTIKTTKANLNS